MAGFPLSAIDKYIQVLIRNGYTIVVIDQDSNGKKGKTRSVKKIVSPGTNIDYWENADSNWSLCIFMDQINDDQIFIGMALCDITTGETKVFEIYSDISDKLYGLDEIYRFIQIHCPSEIIIYMNNMSLNPGHTQQITLEDTFPRSSNTDNIRHQSMSQNPDQSQIPSSINNSQPNQPQQASHSRHGQ